jgi:hypothetical protein
MPLVFFALCASAATAVSCTRVVLQNAESTDLRDQEFVGCGSGDDVIRGAAVFIDILDLDSAISATFTDCQFERCETGNNGGTVYVSDPWICVAVAGCRFAGCRAAAGGGLYAAFVRSFSMNRTAASNCSAAGMGALCFSVLQSPSLGALVIDAVSATGCSGRQNSLLLSAQTAGSVNPMVVECLNSSRNAMLISGSGAAVSGYFAVGLHFWVLTDNGHGNCLVLESNRASDISCLTLANNTCKTMSVDVSGLICISTYDTTLASCVFHSNLYDFFVGTRNIFVVVTFWRCAFDPVHWETGAIGPQLTLQAAVALATTGCVYEPQLTQFPECLNAEQSGSDTNGTARPSREFTAAIDYRTTRRHIRIATAFAFYVLD